MNKNTLEIIKKSVVFIGGFYKDAKGELIKSKLIGTGFLAAIHNQLYLITAKHVVCVLDDQGNIIEEKQDLDFFTKLKVTDKTKALTTLPNSMYYITGNPFNLHCYSDLEGKYWYTHPNPFVDLAITKIKDEHNDGFANDIQPFNFINFDNLGELSETEDVFYISFQPGISDIETDKDISPIFRKGSISRINQDKTLFIDGFTFFGNSGSPVFITKIRGKTKIVNFIGIIGTELTHTTTQFNRYTGEEVIVNQENTGLSMVWSVNFINEIIGNIKILK